MIEVIIKKNDSKKCQMKKRRMRRKRVEMTNKQRNKKGTRDEGQRSEPDGEGKDEKGKEGGRDRESCRSPCLAFHLAGGSSGCDHPRHASVMAGVQR